MAWSIGSCYTSDVFVRPTRLREQTWTISASKVKLLCTRSEIAIVRASRKPQLEQLSAAEVKRLVVRTRKLFDKWQSLGRGQSRARRRKIGSSALDTNMRLKSQIFRDALQSFEAQLAKLDFSVAPSANTSRPKIKKARTRGHRTTRAAIRKGMTSVKDLLNIRDTKQAKRL